MVYRVLLGDCGVNLDTVRSVLVAAAAVCTLTWKASHSRDITVLDEGASAGEEEDLRFDQF